MATKERAGHTPGPWKAQIGRLRQGYSTFVVEVRSERGGPPIVAWPGFDDSDRPHEEHAANARLIAAAPDLFAACELALERYKSQFGATAGGASGEERRVIEAALSRATGQAR